MERFSRLRPKSRLRRLASDTPACGQPSRTALRAARALTLPLPPNKKPRPTGRGFVWRRWRDSHVSGPRAACGGWPPTRLPAGSRLVPRCARRELSPFHCRQTKNPVQPDGVLFGGDGEIRTLEELLTLTRFPIVRARPTTRHLHVFAQEDRINLSACLL